MICIYHSRDLDGWTSGAIVKRKYPNVILIGYDYGEDFPMDKIPVGEHVIMIDVSLKMDEMAKLVAHCSQVTWVDHHISAYKEYQASSLYNSGKNFTVAFDNTISACEGGWKYFFPDEPMPEAVKLLGEFDTWRKPDMERWNMKTMPFQFGMRAICGSPETFLMDLFEDSGEGYVSKIIENGRLILNYQNQMNESQCKRAFEHTFEGQRAICLNLQGGGSDAFKSVYDPNKHDIMIPFQFNGREWIFSLYTDKPEIDCSVIANKYGGGGHRGASGFQVDDISIVFPFIK